MGTKANPGGFDCYAAAAPSEPLFELLGRDKHAPALVRLWARLRALDGEDGLKVREALECADRMEIFRDQSGRPVAPVEEAFATLIVSELVRQLGRDTVDNLGDAESVILLGLSPAVNLAELATALIGKGRMT